MTIPPHRLAAAWASLPYLPLLAILIGSCGRPAGLPTAAPGPSPIAAWSGSPALREAVRAQERLSDRLLSLPGVTGTAASVDEAGRPLVLVLLDRPGRAGIPATFSGARVVTEVTGVLRPFALTARERPAPIGVSAGNANDCVPGTLGCVLEIGNARYYLSANHVFARQNAAAIGEAIVQPSLPDLDPGCGPAPANATVGTLADFEPVVYDGKTPNTMDAAIARVQGRVDCATPAPYYGLPASSIAAPEMGLPLMKVGRTTELTRATIKGVNAKVKLAFPSGTALFVGQVITSAGFGAFGDSGALAVTDDAAYRPVGMLIGGGSNGSAVVTPIGVVLDRFAARICGG